MSICLEDAKYAAEARQKEPAAAIQKLKHSNANILICKRLAKKRFVPNAFVRQPSKQKQRHKI